MLAINPEAFKKNINLIMNSQWEALLFVRIDRNFYTSVICL